jgi:hypothetical protein
MADEEVEWLTEWLSRAVPLAALIPEVGYCVVVRCRTTSIQVQGIMSGSGRAFVGPGLSDVISESDIFHVGKLSTRIRACFEPFVTRC